MFFALLAGGGLVAWLAFPGLRSSQSLPTRRQPPAFKAQAAKPIFRAAPTHGGPVAGNTAVVPDTSPFVSGTTSQNPDAPCWLCGKPKRGCAGHK